MDSYHEANHFPPGHLGIDTFLNNLVTFKLTKDAGDISVIRLQIFLDAF